MRTGQRVGAVRGRQRTITCDAVRFCPSGVELAVYLASAVLLAAVFAGAWWAVLGLVGLPLAGCGRQRT